MARKIKCLDGFHWFTLVEGGEAHIVSEEHYVKEAAYRRWRKVQSPARLVHRLYRKGEQINERTLLRK